MKKRHGFVSNSSSSSFTCDVCGETQSGWDLGLSEAEMSECEHGHLMCDSHRKSMTTEQKVEWLIAQDESLTETVLTEDPELLETRMEEHEARYKYPSAGCPICQMEKFVDRDLFEYLLRKNKTNRKELGEQIKKEFPTYWEFSQSFKNL